MWAGTSIPPCGAGRSGRSVRPEFGVQNIRPVVVRQIAIHQDIPPIDHGKLSHTLELRKITLGRKDDRGPDSLGVRRIGQDATSGSRQ